MNAVTSRAASAVAGTRPILWQRPRPQQPPADFDALVAELHTVLAAIGVRFQRAALASSLSAEDTVLAHAIATVGAGIDVFMIDTGRLHRETLAVRDATEERLGIEIQVVVPDAAVVERHVAAHGRFGFYDSVDLRHACCHLRKVEPLERALAGRDAWLTGQRRAHGPERAGLQVEDVDAARGIAKFNPLAAWSDEAVWHYIDRHALPANALYAQGYPSIGCEPCTRPIRADEDARAGRWWWENAAAKECGLHVNPHSAGVSSEANVSEANVKALQPAAGDRPASKECGLHVAAPVGRKENA
jgi:phosphoadenosine phosphosulfate reductase